MINESFHPSFLLPRPHSLRKKSGGPVKHLRYKKKKKKKRRKLRAVCLVLMMPRRDCTENNWFRWHNFLRTFVCLKACACRGIAVSGKQLLPRRLGQDSTSRTYTSACSEVRGICAFSGVWTLVQSFRYRLKETPCSTRSRRFSVVACGHKIAHTVMSLYPFQVCFLKSKLSCLTRRHNRFR